MRLDCSHPDFQAEVDVDRITDVYAFSATVRIQCAACGERFVFISPKSGVLLDEPTTNADGTELRAPIRPLNGRPGGILTGFTVKGSSGDG